jgi:hypothetical protein
MPGIVASVSSVTRWGCPYSFPAPAEINATRGRTAASSAGEVDESEPW